MCVSSNVYLSISIPPKVFQKAFFLPYSRPWHDGKYCRAVHNILPVSYTHLTLPTKLEV